MGFFDNLKIITTRNGSGTTTGYREDLAPSDVISAALNSYRGVTSVDWYIVGRPAFSSSGGAGPEPIYLATAPSATFTVDADTGGVRRDGTYILLARVNAGAPNETEVTVALARTSGLTIPTPTGFLNLRKLGGFEALEDTSIPAIEQGWATQLDGWLELVRQLALGGSASTTLSQAYAHGSFSGDQTLTLLDAKGGGLVVDGTNVGYTGVSAFRVNAAAGGPVVVDRATGRVGIGTATPAQALHVAGSAPTLRLDRTGGVAIDVANVADELQFLNGALVLAKLKPTGGLQADLGVGIGTVPATAPALALGAGSSAGLSAASTARFRYNELTGHAEFSENGGPYQPFSAPFSAYQTVEQAGAALVQRTLLNFTAAFAASDNVGATRTDVDLANVGPGAGTIGGSGIASLSLDAKGRVTAATTATYATVASLLYQQVQNSGVNVTQRTVLNFTGGLVAVDNSGAGRTDVTTSLATGAIGFGSGANTLTGDAANLAWDSANLRQGIGLAAPGFQLHLRSQSTDADFAQRGITGSVYNGTGNNSPLYRMQTFAGSAASPAIIPNTSYQGTLAYEAYDGTNLLRTVQVGAHGINGSTFATGSLPSVYYVAVDPRGVTDPFAANNPLPIQAQVSPTSARGYTTNVTLGGLPGPTASTFNALTVIGRGVNGSGHNGRIEIRNLTTGADQGADLTLTNDNRTAHLTYNSGTTTAVEGGNSLVLTSGAAGGSVWIEPGLATFEVVNATKMGTLAAGGVNIHQVGTPNGGSTSFITFSTDLDAQFSQIRQTSSAFIGPEGPSTTNFENFFGATQFFANTDFANTLRIQHLASGTPSVIQGGSLGTSATDGYLYVSSWAGPQAGTPTTQGNSLPIGIDRSNNAFQYYSSGAWRTLSPVTLFYQTVEQAGVGLTQRPILNFSARLNATDNLGATRTDVDLATSGVSAGSYTSANITVDIYGRVTLASSGTSGTVTSVGGTLPIQSSGGSTPVISLLFDNVTVTLNGSNQIQRAGLTGDVTAAAGSNATTISANAVTNAKLRQSAARSVIGNATNALANVADISATASGQVLQDLGTTIGWAALAYSSLTGTPTLFYQTVAQAGSALAQRVTLNASTGLTAVDNGGAGRTDVTVNLSTGLSGGQAVVGGTAAGEALHLVSTNSATRGQVYFGAATSDFYDESTGNLVIGGAHRIGIGTSTPSQPLDVRGAVAIGTHATGQSTRLVGFDNSPSFSQLGVYPDAGGNVGSLLYVIPRGTGVAGNHAGVVVFQTDFVADSANYEMGAVRADGTQLVIGTARSGTGSARPIMLASDYLTNGTTNANQILLNTNGTVTMSSLGTGLVKATSGTLGLGAAGIDYQAPLTGTPGSVAFFGGAGTITQDNANLFYDQGAHSVGIGTATPQTRLDVNGSIAIGSHATGVSPSLRNPDNAAGAAQLFVYPMSGSNINSSVSLIPRGSATSGLFVFNTDFVVDGANYEYASVRAGGSQFSVTTNAAGTGAVRALLIQTGANTNQLLLSTNGQVSLSSLSGGGDALVYGTAGGILTRVTLGSGLTFSGGVLSSTGGGGGLTPPAANEIVVSTGANLTGAATFTFSANDLKVGDGTTASRIISVSTAAGSAGFSAWKDAAASRAAHFGIGVPGSAPTNDAVISTFNGTAWTEQGRFSAGGGNLILATGTVKVPGVTASSIVATDGSNFLAPVIVDSPLSYSGGHLSVSVAPIAAQAPVRMFYTFYAFNWSISSPSTWFSEGGSTLVQPAGTVLEYPIGITPSTVQLSATLIQNNMTSGTMTVFVTQNGAGVGGTGYTITPSTPPGTTIGSALGVSASSTDTWGLAASGASTSGSGVVPTLIGFEVTYTP